jgi:hypothetical protein
MVNRSSRSYEYCRAAERTASSDERVSILLRPPELIEARTAFNEARLDAGSLQAVENAAILGVLEQQRQVQRGVRVDAGGADPLSPLGVNDRLLLEYDSERAGGFEPLRFVPP